MHNQDIFKKFPIIDCKDFVLRELSINDVENFYHYISKPEVNKFLSQEDFPRDIIQAKKEILYWYKLFYLKHSIFWAIADKKTNHIIGTCGYNNINFTHKRIEISYDLDYLFWGKGIMTRAVKAICKFAFENINVIRIQATVSSDNARSIKLLENNNFLNEGKMQNYAILHNEIKDYYMYALLKER